MTDSTHQQLKRLLEGQARIEQRLRDVYRAMINLEDSMAQTAQDIAAAIGDASRKLTDTRQSMNAAFHTLLDKIAALAAQGDLSAVESAVTGLRGEVDSITSDVVANTTSANTPA